jgi:uncharacterized protein
MITSGNFKPAWYLRNPHLQTILANINKPPIPTVSYETVQLDDGDSLQLARGTANGSSTVLILHGLEGSLNSAYARRLVDYLNKRNIPVVFMFFRSCNGKPNLKARSYHSGETGDLRNVISYLKRQGTQSIALVGYSLGGNVTLKYMGEGQVDDSVVCATGVSTPLLLDVCARRMNKGFSRLYQHTLLKRLLSKVAQKRHIFQHKGYNPDLKVKNFIEFDDAFTAPLHGFDSAQDYYEKSSSRQFLNTIEKPTLILHAQDDPFMTAEVIPESSELSEHVRLEISPHGGHVGFVTRGLLKQENWLEPRIYQWLEQHFL